MTVNFKITQVYKRISQNWDNRYIIAYGGSSSSKSVSILQKLTIYAYQNKNKRIVLSGESLPVMKKTLLPDWKQIVMGELFDSAVFNKSEMTYTFPTGTVFSFVPADDPSRFHGMRQDIVYFDEVFYIKKAIYDQADIRTKDKVISSFNPASRFWIADNFDDASTYVDHSTYKDNPYISKQIIEALEKRAGKDKNFYDVYVRGLFGSLEGLIFQEGVHWGVKAEWPDEFKQEVYGLDFGFSVDPAALVHIRYSDGELWLRERLYERNMTNADLVPYLDGLTIADSAEPKSIEELRRLKVNIRPSVKGKDSINNGIQLMKQFKLNVHSESVNLIKELRNYTWQENRQGETLTKPIDDHNHCFVGETMIAVFGGFKRIDEIIPMEDIVITSTGLNRVNNLFNNGLQQVTKYTLHFGTFSLSLSCTKDHKFKTTNGWKKIHELRKDDVLYLHKPLTGKHTTNTMEKGTTQKVLDAYTWSSGNTSRGKYLKAITYTTRTGTRRITKLKTLIWLMQNYTSDLRERSDLKTIQSLLKHFTRKVLRLLKIGIGLKKAENGTQNMAKKCGLIDHTSQKYANNAAMNTPQDIKENRSIAITTAKLKHLEKGEKSRRIVYDMEIAGTHEYLANGVLVHNCIDATRYGVYHLFNKRNVFFI